MSARVTVLLGPAGSGKTERLLARYRPLLADARARACALWLAPTARSVSQVRGALLGGELAACFHPGVMTFSQFADRVVQSSPAPNFPIGESLKRVVIRRLLGSLARAGQLRHFAPIATTRGLIETTSDLIRELKRLDIWPQDFESACRSRGMTDRDHDLHCVYDEYQRYLTQRNLYDAEGRFWSARSILRTAPPPFLDAYKLVVADGFTDFTAAQHEILQILATRAGELVITLPLEPRPIRNDLFAKSQATLATLRERHAAIAVEELPRPTQVVWPGMAHLEQQLFKNPREAQLAADTAGIEILAASQSLGEVELIARRIKRLLTCGDPSAGARPVRPRQIVVVFRSLSETAPLVREVFQEYGIPAAIEGGQSLERCAALGSLLLLLRVEFDDWPFHVLLAALTNQLLRPDWPEWRAPGARMAAEQLVRALQIPHGRRRLFDKLEQVVSTGLRPRTADGSDDEAGRAARRLELAKLAAPLLRRLAGLYDKLPRQAPIGQWLAALEQFAEECGLLAALQTPSTTADQAGVGARDDPNRDEYAWSALKRAIAAVARFAPDAGGETLFDRTALMELLADLMRWEQSVDTTDETGRVRVLSAPSVRALRVEYLFLAGLAETAFPAVGREERVYSEAEAQKLIEAGLPLILRHQREQDEMLLFYEVATRATRRLFLSYPALDDKGQALLPSPFLAELDRACGAGRIAHTEVADLKPIPQDPDPRSPREWRVRAVADAADGKSGLLASLAAAPRTADLAENLLAALRLASSRGGGDGFGAFEGILSSPVAAARLSQYFDAGRSWSASELEQYALCPFQFFVERILRLAPLAELALAADFAGRGRRLHQVLAALHQSINRAGGGPASPGSLDEPAYQSHFATALDEVWQAEGVADPLETALREIDRQLLVAWRDVYYRQHQEYDALAKRTALPSHFEVSFGLSKTSPDTLSTAAPLVLCADGEMVKVSGRIDRIDLGCVGGQEVFNIIDYKSGRTPPPKKKDVVAGTALQLAIYSIAVEEVLLAGRGAMGWRAGYWHVRGKGFAKETLLLGQASDEPFQPTPDWQALREQTAQRVVSLVRSIRSGQFPMHSADEHCTSRCPYSTICRVHQVRSLEKTWQPSAPTPD